MNAIQPRAYEAPVTDGCDVTDRSLPQARWRSSAPGVGAGCRELDEPPASTREAGGLLS